MFVGVANPLALRRDPEHLLGDDHAEQLHGAERGLTTRVMITRKAERGHDPIIEMNVKCA